MSLNIKELVREEAMLMVIWDESKETVFKKLAEAGFSDEEVAEIYKEAMKARVDLIREECAKEIAIGFASLFFAAVVFLASMRLTGGVSNNLLALIFVIGTIGLWKSLKGLMEYANAGSKRGSLAEED